MKKKELLKYLKIIGVVGGVLLIASFFLKVADIGINDVEYSASGLDLAQWRIHPDYLGGIGGGSHYIKLDAGFEIFYLIPILGALSLPLCIFKDSYLSSAGALSGILGILFLIVGFTQFNDAYPEWSIGVGYGLVLGILGGLLIVITNIIAVYILVRKKKPKKKEEAPS